ncbi:NUDIX hydrolase [Salinarchaeum laminariae]|uniref:NUDIX hydrolase n=1 Tax=Salinarchaeum laminariae TaxID=869888 RepID=UPI0020BF473D|nr:NUDIX domain-containing protein [Salinarchaeum laminariae]
MPEETIRPLAIGIPTRDEEVLLAEHEDPTSGEQFYRPVGGGIEFGEHSREALKREFTEELDVTVSEATQLTTLERTFTQDGEPAHEIWRCYHVSIVEDWPYETDSFTAHEPELDHEFPVRWIAIDELDDHIVYPESLPELLESA